MKKFIILGIILVFAIISGVSLVSCQKNSDSNIGLDTNIEDEKIVEEKPIIPPKQEDTFYKISKPQTNPAPDTPTADIPTTENKQDKNFDNIQTPCTHPTKVVEKRQAPTCLENGYTEKIVCEKCGKVLQEREIIPKLGHDFKDKICTHCGLTDYKGNYSFTKPTSTSGDFTKSIAISKIDTLAIISENTYIFSEKTITKITYPAEYNFDGNAVSLVNTTTADMIVYPEANGFVFSQTYLNDIYTLTYTKTMENQKITFVFQTDSLFATTIHSGSCIVETTENQIISQGTFTLDQENNVFILENNQSFVFNLKTQTISPVVSHLQ